MKNTLICAPVHKQPSKEWIDALRGEEVLIISDAEAWGNTLDLPFEIHDYARQKEELGEAYEEFAELFHKDAACKIYGLLQGYLRDYKNVIVLDSDCRIPARFVEEHEHALEKQVHGWTNPLEEIGWFPRGYPYSERDKNIVVNMGLWSNNLDINGKDRIGKDVPTSTEIDDTRIAHNEIPLCGMNLIIKREAIPGLLFLPAYKWKHLDFQRYDDIYGGYIFEQMIKKSKDVLVYGKPIVFHEDPVDPVQDAKEERAMIFMEDAFYQMVDEMFKDIPRGTYKEMFSDFADKTDIFKETAFEGMIKPIKFMKKLYE